MRVTGPLQKKAQGLYRRLGFCPTSAYYPLAPDMGNWLVFMELDLGRSDRSVRS